MGEGGDAVLHSKALAEIVVHSVKRRSVAHVSESNHSETKETTTASYIILMSLESKCLFMVRLTSEASSNYI